MPDIVSVSRLSLVR